MLPQRALSVCPSACMSVCHTCAPSRNRCTSTQEPKLLITASNAVLFLYLSGTRSSAGRAGKVRTKNFVERRCGVDGCARVVESQRVEYRLTTVVVSQVEPTVRRRQTGNSTDTHIARVNVQTVRYVCDEQHRVLVPLRNPGRDGEYEHDIHLPAATCTLHHNEDVRLNYLRSTEMRSATYTTMPLYVYVSMPPWNCSVVLDGQLYANSRRHSLVVNICALPLSAS